VPRDPEKRKAWQESYREAKRARMKEYDASPERPSRAEISVAVTVVQLSLEEVIRETMSIIRRIANSGEYRGADGTLPWGSSFHTSHSDERDAQPGRRCRADE
jgi:hypothetical protein